MDHEQFGTTDDYFRAFKRLVAEGIPENHLALLRAHHTAPHHRATWAQLAAAIGYANGKAVNLPYGTLAARVAQLMGIAEVPNGFWLDVLAGWADERDAVSGHTSFILRHPVIEALTRLGVLTGVATGSSVRVAEMYARLGDEGVKPYVITIDEISAEQYSSLREHTGPNDSALASVEPDAAGIPAHVSDKIIGPLYEWSLKLTAQEYVAGLTAIQPTISDLQKRLLVNQYHAPDRTVFATELARMVNVSGGHPTVNAQYGRLGRLFVNATGHQPDRRHDGSNRWWAVWSRGFPTRKGFIWQMLPAVAAALESLGWVSKDVVTMELPERADTPQPPASDPRWAHRAGTTVAKPEGSHTRRGLGAIEVEQEHNRLQNSLFQRLCR